MKQLANLITRLNMWWNLKTNQRYWYNLKYTYSKKGVVKSEWYAQIGLLDKRDVLNGRELKNVTPLHKISFKNQLDLCNGQLQVTVLCYLGRFSKKAK